MYIITAVTPAHLRVLPVGTIFMLSSRDEQNIKKFGGFANFWEEFQFRPN